MKFHLPSLAVGGCLAAASGIQIGAQAPGPSALPASAAKQAVQATGKLTVGGIPTPDQMRTIGAGEAFVVPPGARYVVTGVGATDQLVSQAQIRFDDVPVIAALLFNPDDHKTTVAIPPGMVAEPGTTIQAAPDTVVIFGYLARLNESPDLTLKGVPLASEMISVPEGQSLIVPAGKRLVLTGVGSTGGETTARVLIDGTEVVEIRIDSTTGHAQFLPAGLTAPSGAQVEIAGSIASSTSVLLGYLADA